MERLDNALDKRPAHLAGQDATTITAIDSDGDELVTSSMDELRIFAKERGVVRVRAS